MWACLQDHDTANHWKQVAGWRKVCDLAQTHLGRLQQYRRGLAEAWPPETSAASRTYLAELDELIDKVQRTHDAAAANYTALSAATQAIGTTRAALRKIYEEYATKFQQKQAYESMVADPKAVMGNRATQPPVADGELERLNVQARSMMFSLSGELQQAQATLQKPPPRPAPRVDEEAATTTAAAAPIIPPIVPVPIQTTARISTSSGSLADPPGDRMPIARGIGPVLGGATAMPVPAVQDLPRVQQIGHANQPPGMGIPPSLGPVPNTSKILGPPIEQRGPAGRSLPEEPRVNGANSAPTPRPMPPSGLIGGTPGLGLGQPTSGQTAPRRVNPIGGVIGGGSAGTAPTGGAGSRPSAPRASGSVGGMSPIGGAPGNGANWHAGALPTRPNRWIQSGGDGEPDRWDPDHPWRTEQGVAPVVLPRDEDGPIDPGPALGLPR
ncbi:hypothetical protein IW249_002680 [Micromonospora vinacea]|uniref:PPE family protein n=1 Tax=Micromonospora vinacea TaxID=709878 RepID=A0ABS0K0X5_9ACTN|nr:hypothetical protein [Micromonospora vinacea]